MCLRILKIALNQVILYSTQQVGEIEGMKADRLSQLRHPRKESCLRSELPCNEINECDSRIMALCLTAFLGIVLSKYASLAEADKMRSRDFVNKL